MTRSPHPRALLALLSLLLAACNRTAPPPDTEYVQEVEAWRAGHEESYRRQYVPLAGLFFLDPGENTAGSHAEADVVLPSRAPLWIGRFVYTDRVITFAPAAGADVRLRGEPLSATVTLRPDGEPEPRDELQVDDMTLWVHKSGERRAIRLRDPQGEVATSFAGFTWYAIDPEYRVTARFVRDPAPRQIRVASLSGDDQVYMTEGVLEFTLRGERLRMRPMTTRPGRLFLVFRDVTSGKDTYAAARFLYADLEPDETAVLDFNQAYNPPCAFNPYTTCPLPLPENRLTIPIAAGELDYHGPR